MAKTEPKVLYFDIETIKTMFSGKRKLEAEDCAVVMFQYAWGDKGKVKIIHAGQDPKRFKKDVFDDSYVLKEAAKVILEADFIVAHYGSGFDKRMLRTRFILKNLDKAAMHIQRIKLIDTCYMARKLLAVRSSSLRYLAKLLGITQKLDCGQDVWEGVRSGKITALRKMISYGKGDIDTLRELYLRLRHYDHNHPNFNFTNKPACGTCGSEWIVIGKRPLLVGKKKYKKLHCRKCGADTRGGVYNG